MINIMRLGHRIHRDIRITTHLALTARAFLADNFYYTGQRDKKFEESISKINERWGSNFKVFYLEDHKKFLSKDKSLKVHLTVYGSLMKEKIKQIKSHKDITIIVGGQKVPPDIYQLTDLNVSITTQPISEISALSILLNEIFEGKALSNSFSDAKLKIIPQERGKKIIKG